MEFMKMEVINMKYSKPIVLLNEELAEGVYAASGGPQDADCYTVTYNMHQKPETGRGDYRIQINGSHITAHHGTAQTLVISFDKPVTYSGSNGTLVSGDGTNTLSIAFTYHNNGVDNIGMGDVVVVADAGLSVTGAALYCNKTCDQHDSLGNY